MKKGVFKMSANTITDCELQVMMVIWESEKQLTLPDILERVNEKYAKNWKAPTVSTFLARLVKKEFLSMQRTGRTFIYKSLVDQVKYKENVLQEDLDFWCYSSLADLVKSLSKVRTFSNQEKEEVRKMLE